jgi:hypothetical protein
MMHRVLHTPVTSSDCEDMSETAMLDKNLFAAKRRSRACEGCLADIMVLNRTFGPLDFVDNLSHINLRVELHRQKQPK